MSARCPVGEAPFRARRAEPWLGTLVDITASSISREALDEGLRAAFAAVARIHRAMSGHDSASELTRINRDAASAKQSISTDLRAVLTCALDLAARSQSVFDPTVGAELAALGFLPPHTARERGATWRDVVLDDDGVLFRRPLALDFDGIAKGYAVDCAIAALRDAGATQAIVNAGGDLRVHGPAVETVQLRTGGAQSAMLPLVTIGDGAVATSAYGSRRRRLRGRFVTPLVDPRSRLPSMSTRTVSVVAPTCIVADALTKVVALDGARAARVLASYCASATIVSPMRGRWRCTRLPR